VPQGDHRDPIPVEKTPLRPSDERILAVGLDEPRVLAGDPQVPQTEVAARIPADPERVLDHGDACGLRPDDRETDGTHQRGRSRGRGGTKGPGTSAVPGARNVAVRAGRRVTAAPRD
jgi:hypothetical protein